MSFWNTLRVALVALRVNALRSFLTMLGIIIGIASVIVMVSVSSGSKAEVEAAIERLGSHMLTLRPGTNVFGGRRAGAGTAAPFTEGDLLALRERFPFIEGISGSIGATAPVIFGNRNWTTSITGVHADYLAVRQWVIATGRGFTPREVRTGAKVALVGQAIVDELFEGSSPIGARIRIRNVPFQVIGTLEAKGESTFGRSQDDVVFVPISTARMRLVGRSLRTTADAVGTVFLTVDPAVAIGAAQEELEAFLAELRGIAPGGQADFSIANFSEFVRARAETSTTLGLLLAATAAIALLVGGIGIMNIMLVSVTERTREIGLRMAVGARRGDILRQFLVEAVTLCVIGSIVGVALGVGGGELLRGFSEVPVRLEPSIVVVAIASAALVGVSFGFYPARKASRLAPIDALRHE